MKIAHIGFGKTATTALQNAIFPKLAERIGSEYINVDDVRIRAHAAHLIFEKDVRNKIEASPTFVLSAEDLHGWDPYFWEGHAERNLRFLGEDCHILITLREPRSYLTSVYLQTCLHEGNIQSPSDFFLDSCDYSPYNCAAKFAITDFSYLRIINLYRQRFKQVTIVKYETMETLSFLKHLVDIDDKTLQEFRVLFSGQIVNKSFSSRSVWVTLKLQRFLNFLGMSLQPNTVQGSLVALDYLRWSATQNLGINENRDMPFDIGQKLLRYLCWSSLMHRMDRYFKGQKFEIDFDQLPQIDFLRLSKEYRELPDVATFCSNEHKLRL